MSGNTEPTWSRHVSQYPTSDDGSIAPGAEPIPLEQLSDLACLVLLGEPGIGKTHALDLLRAVVKNAQTIEIDLGRHDVAGIERAFSEVVMPAALRLDGERELHLFFDAVDESTVGAKRLARLLTGHLGVVAAAVPFGRLRLRFASRPIAWPAALQQGLEGLLQGSVDVAQRWLLPLYPEELHKAAVGALGGDADPFLNHIKRHGIEPLACRPVALRLLMLLWRRGDRDLPRARVEIYDRGLRCLLSEARYDGREPLELEAGYRLARLLAGLMLLSSRSAIWAGPEGAETSSSLRVVDVADAVAQIGGYDVATLTRHLRQLLHDLPLGRSGHEGEWRFSHRSFAEFLAASWLAESQADDGTVIRLLTDDSAEPGLRRVVPQLSGVSAWLADVRSGVFERLLIHDPELALRTDLEASSPEFKSRITEALLAALDNDRVDAWDWHESLGRLRHSGLSNQLREWIADPNRHLFARRTAIRIAKECEIDDLKDVLRAVLDEPAEENNLRELAAGALINSYRREESWSEIVQLAAAGLADPDDSILGDALRALWPAHIRFVDLVSLCREPRRLMYFGVYRMFLSKELVPGLSDDDLLAALKWFVRLHQAWGHADRFLLDEPWNQLLERLRGARAVPARDLAEALVAPLFEGPDALRYGGYAQRVAAFLTIATATQRLAVVEVCVERMALEDQPSWSATLDIRTADVSVNAIEIGLALGDSVAGRIAFELAERTSDVGRAEEVERLRVAAEASPVARGVFRDLLELGQTAEEIAAAVQRRREPYVRPSRPVLDPPPAQRVAQRVRQALSGDHNAFPDLVFRQLVLAHDATIARQEVPEAIVATPGWVAADPATRHDIGRAALAWLTAGDPHEEEWLGTDRLDGDAIAGLLAIGHLHSQQPALYAQVSPTLLSRWAMAILSGTSSMNWQDHPVVPLGQGIHADPSGFAERLGRHLRGTSSSPSVYLRRLSSVWAPELSSLMRLLVVDAASDASQAERVYDYATAWIEHGDPSEFIVDDDARYDVATRAALISAHLKADPEAHWDRIWSAVKDDDELARRVFLRVGKGQWGRSEFAASMRTASRMAQLVERLTELFPPADDPHHEGAHFIGERESVAELRDGTLRRLATLGTRDAARALLAMQQRGFDSSCRLSLRALVQDAIRGALEGEWRPRSLATLAKLVLGGRRASLYLSSRFHSALREKVRSRLSTRYEVFVTEGLARPDGVRDSVRDDAERADVMVQVLEWSSGLGDREQTGGSALEQEHVIAQALRRQLLAAVLTDSDVCPEPLGRYLAELRVDHVLIERADPEELVDGLERSVDDYFDRMMR